MAYPPPRRRDGPSRYSSSYYPPPSDDRFVASPPRRHNSERRPPRHRSPGIPPSDDIYSPRRGRGRQEPPEPRGAYKPPPYGSHKDKSPPHHSYKSQPPPFESRRELQREPPSRHGRDTLKNPYDQGCAPPLNRDYRNQPRDGRHSHRDELEYRPRRDRASPPPAYDRHHKRDSHASRSQRSRVDSPGPRPRGRDFAAPPPGSRYMGEDDRRRSARSHDRSKQRHMSPPRGRDRDISHASKTPSSRRKSAPAPVQASTKAAKNAWWKNPLIQAGARTALTAGAQAAMQNRNDPSPWLGSKGAKVATAALGAALMDGFGSGKKNK